MFTAHNIHNKYWYHFYCSLFMIAFFVLTKCCFYYIYIIEYYCQLNLIKNNCAVNLELMIEISNYIQLSQSKS